MRNVRRYIFKGNIYFLTHVTHNRAPILVDEFDLLWYCLQFYKAEHSYELLAWVVMPDHVHLLIDPLDSDLPGLMRKVKLKFSGLYRHKIGIQKGNIWQHRYWDHVIRNQDDMNTHLDYIHYNPVKHGLAGAPGEYAMSSFVEYRDDGFYPDDWGVEDAPRCEGEFGE